MREEIVLIGPPFVGKTTLAHLLSGNLNLPSIGLDELSWYYYYKKGFNVGKEKKIMNASDFTFDLYKFWKPWEADAVVNMLSDFKNCIFDFGGGQTVYEDDALFEIVYEALFPFKNVILLVPSLDHSESVDFLSSRLESFENKVETEKLIRIKHFIEHDSNRRLAKYILTVKNKTPEQLVDEVLEITNY